MPSIALLAAGLALVAVGGYGFFNPQRQYEIRQWGQTNDDPQLSRRGRLLWQFFDAVFALFGAGTVWLAFTV